MTGLVLLAFGMGSLFGAAGGIALLIAYEAWGNKRKPWDR